MKAPITLLPNKLILIAILLIGGLLILPISLFPEPAKQLMVFDENKENYLEKCPKLTPTKKNGPKNKELKVPFTLLNWNIYKQQKLGGLSQLKQWQDKADLITLQEVKYSEQFELFRETHQLFSFQNIAFNDKNHSYGVNTLSKNKATFICSTRSLEPWLRIHKSAIASVYPIEGSLESLLLINIHAVNFTFTHIALQKQINPYLTLINHHQGPVIFSGDFNSWNKPRLSEIENRLFKIGFNEVFFADDQRTTFLNYPLDHIYFRGLKVNKAESLTTKASDHSAQRVEFALK